MDFADRRSVYLIEAVRAGRERGRVELQPPRPRSALVKRAENHEFETARRFRSGNANFSYRDVLGIRDFGRTYNHFSRN
jgi:hypothetical protein